MTMKGFPGNLQELMQQAQQMQQKMSEAQAELEQHTVDASAGGGMVTATANGAGQIVAISIEKEVINPDDAEMLQDLVRAAVNESLRKSREMAQEQMAQSAGIPAGMGDLLKNFKMG